MDPIGAAFLVIVLVIVPVCVAWLVNDARNNAREATPAPSAALGDVETRPATLVRTYRGAQQADAIASFERDAAGLAADDYYPSSQSWAPGQWGCGAFLVALLLCLLLVGILIFIYLLVVKPEGTLSVTYVRREVRPADLVLAPTEPESVAAYTTGSLADRLRQLDAARDAGLISSEEHARKRDEILSLF